MPSLLAALAEIRDPRRPQGQRYSMGHLLLFSVLAVLAGATSPKDHHLNRRPARPPECYLRGLLSAGSGREHPA